MISKKLIYLIAILLGSLTLNASAQSQHKVVEKRLKEYFRTYESTDAQIGTCKLVRFQLNPQKRTLTIYANANFGYQPFRTEITQQIYSELRNILPGPVNYYNITILVGDKSIDDLIPNLYRKVKDDTRLWGKTSHQGMPWVSNVSLPYRITEGLQGRHLAVTPSHGRYYKNDEQRWKWQRPSLYCTREDLLSQSFVVPYLTPMLENAGAIVFSARERDRQPFDIIIDNDNDHQDCGLYIEEGHRKTQWSNDTIGFAIPKQALRIGDNPFTMGTSRIMHTATHEKRAKEPSYGSPTSPRMENMPYIPATNHIHQASLTPSISSCTQAAPLA